MSVAGREYDQNFIILANQPSPGVAIVAGASAPRDYQVNKGYGLAGASVVYTGDNLAKFGVLIKMWSQVQLDEWKKWSQLLEKPPKGAGARALAIQHPLLDELKIDKVVVEDRTQLTRSDLGLWTCEIKFLQYRKPAPALGRPNGAIPNAPGTIPRAEDLLDAKIQASRDAFNRARDAANGP